LDFQQNESDDSDKGDYTTLTATRNFSDNELFKIGFDWFKKKLDSESRMILRLRLDGYKNREIAEMIGKKFIRYFDLPDSHMATYGLA